MIKNFFQLIFIFSVGLCYAQPNANFTVSSTTACVGQTITMTSISTPNGSPITNYIWSAQGAVIEQGQGANLTSFSFTYTIAGTYNLSLIVQDANGQSSNSFQTNAIQVFDNPLAAISVSNLTCTEPFQLSFNAAGSSVGTNFSYSWTLPGGVPSSANTSSTTSSYLNEGAYLATLRVTNQTSSCYTEVTKNLNLSSFISDFVLPESICKNSPFFLQDSSSTGVNQWIWTASGGTLSGASGPNPTLMINQAGTYTVTLISKNTAAGCQDTVTKNIVVNDLPSISYSENLNFGCAPKMVSLSNTSTPTAGINFTWDFDDGSPLFNGTNPPPHVYTQNNRMYFPKLSAIDQNGCRNFFIGDTIFFFPPEADFKLNPANGCAPMMVQFTDQSYAPTSETIVSWKWNFDDGGTSTLQNPSHLFACGFYDVRLIIQTASGCIDTTYLSDRPINNISASGEHTTVADNISIIKLTDSLTIYRNYNDSQGNNLPYATIRYGEQVSTDFTYSPSVLCHNEELSLLGNNPVCPVDPSEYNDIQYNWSFEGFGGGAGSTSGYSEVFDDTLHFDNPMDISLEIDYRGCISEETTKTDIVYLKGPIANFRTNALFCNEGVGPHSVQVTDTLSIYGHAGDFIFEGTQVVEDQADDDVTLTYDWGDGFVETFEDDTFFEDADKGATSHIYNGFGTYTIKQTIVNHTTMCSDTFVQKIHITEINIGLLTDSVCNLEEYHMSLEGYTTAGHYPISFNTSLDNQNFTFSSGGGQFSMPSWPSFYQHQIPGEKDVLVIATNFLGCTDTLHETIQVLDLPEAVISVVDDTICKNSNAVFSGINSILGDFPSWGNYTWTINNSTVINSINLDTITYFVDDILNLKLRVSDAFSCESENTAQINFVTQGPNASFSHNEFLCNDVNELLDASATNGNMPLSFTWYLDGLEIANSTNDSLYNAIHVTPDSDLFANHTYSLVVSDNKNCTDSISKTVFVSNPRITSLTPTITATYVDVSGNYTCPPVYVDFDLTYQTNYTASDYKWSLGNDFDSDFDSYNANPQGIQYVEAGSYDLYVQMTESTTGCIFSYTEEPFLTIGGPKAEIIITSDPNGLCGMSYLFELINPSNNLHHWSWDLGDGTIQTSAENPDNSFTHTYLDVNDFSPVITLIDDSSQCSIPITKQIDAFENGLDAFFEMNPSNAVVDLNMEFDDLSTSSNSTITSWVWDFGDGDSLTNNAGISAYHTFLDETSKLVTLTISDEFGCTDQYTLPINLFTVNFAMPNIVTNPGENGVNSYFTLFEDIFHDFELIILNRWGNVVHKSSKDPLNPTYLWDGRDFRSGELCSDGVYFYVIEGLLLNGKNIKHQDYITLAGGKF
jgi:PKD repeat protein